MNTNEVYVYSFISRNKDNKGVDGFKERSYTFLANGNDLNDEIIKKFERFVKEGAPGEKSRLYISVNPRNEEKAREEVIIRLIKDKTSLVKINKLVSSAAMKSENAAGKKWLFDFDIDDEVLVNDFCFDVERFGGGDTHYYKTPNGYAVVCEHGFDIREVIELWKGYDVSLKRDALLFVKMAEKIGG